MVKFDFQDTSEITLPTNPLEKIIGQDEAIRLARICAIQRRNLLLIGPPGTGKSLIAQSMSTLLPKPHQEVSVLHNPQNPERPIIEVREEKDIKREEISGINARILEPEDVPAFVSERLGFRCKRCGTLSSPSIAFCPNCGVDKLSRTQSSPVNWIIGMQEEQKTTRVHTTRLVNGKEEIMVYERFGDKIKVMDQKTLQKLEQLTKQVPRKVIIPLDRKTFIATIGASETELLGDIKHDPYGGHQQIGTPAYLRVTPGTIHEAHEGVLFVDEISTLAHLQKYIYTAMQDKKYPISGRNPTSSGASIKVDDVPCDFILVAASNINDIHNILPPLRSRILGNGYEILLNTYMPDTTENKIKMAQFISMEIKKDGKIPEMTAAGVNEIISEAKRRAKLFDAADNSLTLRLRDLSGIIRLSGDIAIGTENELITSEDVKNAVKQGRTIEEQLKSKYGSLFNASMNESSYEKDPNASKGIN
ncbi:Archaeal Lon protease [uncultured archaeon]|nr:Archaeal Lon protease [uncultured archaeon]